MNLKRIKITLNVLMLIILCSRALAVGDSAAEDKPLEVSEVFTQQKTKNVVVLLLEAHKFQRSGDIPKALELYDQILEKWQPESRWGRVACLKAAKCFLCRRPADFSQAGVFLEKIESVQGDLIWQRERQVWEYVENLHRLTNGWLKGDSSVLGLDIPQNLADWRVPNGLLDDFQRALGGLTERFITNDKAEQGAIFLGELLGRMRNRWMQQVVLRELISMQLLADKAQDALVSARAYWVLSIQKPALFPEAIDKVAQCMKKLGANNEQIEQYRMFQTYGKRSQDGKDGSINSNTMMLFMEKASSERKLIPQELIEKEESVEHKARMLLMNGDIAHAAPLLKSSVEAGKAYSIKERGIIMLIHMALALHDGHIHDIDRYDRYIYQKSLGAENSGKKLEELSDPLDELIKATASANQLQAD